MINGLAGLNGILSWYGFEWIKSDINHSVQSGSKLWMSKINNRRKTQVNLYIQYNGFISI